MSKRSLNSLFYRLSTLSFRRQTLFNPSYTRSKRAAFIIFILIIGTYALFSAVCQLRLSIRTHLVIPLLSLFTSGPSLVLIYTSWNENKTNVPFARLCWSFPGSSLCPRISSRWSVWLPVRCWTGPAVVFSPFPWCLYRTQRETSVKVRHAYFLSVHTIIIWGMKTRLQDQGRARERREHDPVRSVT